ncbi:microtubule-associated protein RP/EB family member 1-like [Anopheles ziemanni]|uniref:microtubule-associated protein RP/EB family member 1-like n=1 Tax=Anopheles coustani TaxID=139045 RepID=UPI002657DAB3|nr:microtubule-associated protein RP/EB family member 1-like [Anopheles coustani]XP_058166165.1 microtubule-associated protein RP/EB family member 1-like [Anopheles ziemanni]
MAVNVHFTGQTSDNLSRIELLAWINRTLLSDFKKVEELCTGAAYCQLMDVLFPGCISIKRVKYCTNVEHDFLSNLRMFQNALVQLKVDRSVPIERLAKGRFQDNFEFLQWFKKFFDANYDGKEYDPQAARNHVPMGYGTPNTLRPSQKLNTGSSGGLGAAMKRAGSNGSTSRLQAAGKGGKNTVSEQKAWEKISTLASNIDDLTVKIQDAEISREYYYKKLVMIEKLINENTEDEQDAFCSKVKEIMYATE